MKKWWIIFLGAVWGGFLLFLFMTAVMFVLVFRADIIDERRTMLNSKTYTVVGETLALCLCAVFYFLKKKQK